MRYFKVPFLPMVLGVVLGFMVESNYRRALVLSGGDHMTFVRDPISGSAARPRRDFRDRIDSCAMRESGVHTTRSPRRHDWPHTAIRTGGRRADCRVARLRGAAAPAGRSRRRRPGSCSSMSPGCASRRVTSGISPRPSKRSIEAGRARRSDTWRMGEAGGGIWWFRRVRRRAGQRDRRPRRGFDDTFEGGPVHSGAVVVPAVLAVCERERLGGDRLLAGIATGAELMCRLSLVAPTATHKAGFHPTAVFGALAAAGAASRGVAAAARRNRLCARHRRQHGLRHHRIPGRRHMDQAHACGLGGAVGYARRADGARRFPGAAHGVRGTSTASTARSRRRSRPISGRFSTTSAAAG